MRTLTDLCEAALEDGKHTSLGAIALEAGMARETLSRLLACRMRQPGAVLLAGLAEALGVDLQTVYDAWSHQCQIAGAETQP
jgi:transcriptional regulator with XRE-family HTH domain